MSAKGSVQSDGPPCVDEQLEADVPVVSSLVDVSGEVEAWPEHAAGGRPEPGVQDTLHVAPLCGVVHDKYLLAEAFLIRLGIHWFSAEVTGGGYRSGDYRSRSGVFCLLPSHFVMLQQCKFCSIESAEVGLMPKLQIQRTINRSDR